jgi:tryptophan synthase alpha chain
LPREPAEEIRWGGATSSHSACVLKFSPKVKTSSRITERFEKLAQAGEGGFVAYITAGDPSFDATLEVALALDQAGVDILELGIPFSDPLADGPTIQAASTRALAAGMTVTRALELVSRIRETSQIPIVFFTYLNPIYVYGFEKFLTDAVAAGADGLLILDLPPAEAKLNADLVSSGGLAPIRLIAPTTSPERMAAITETGEGFIYYVSREGVTGEQTSLSDSIGEQVAEIRKHTKLPIAVGFGISTPEQSRSVSRQSDAVVVGSAIVRRIAEHGGEPDLGGRIAAFVKPLVEAARSR